MSDDIKQLVSELVPAFEEFKKANDERLERVEKGLSDDALLNDKIGKIEADLDRLEDVNQRLSQEKAAQDSVNEKVASLETALARPATGYDAKSIDENVALFDKYCRKGKESLDPMELKALTVSNDTTGGYLAPPEYVRELLKSVTEISPIRSIARIRTTSQRSVQVPKRTGQFAASWVAESGTRSETSGYTVGLEEIPAHEMYALVDISEQDLEDTVFDLEAEMQSEFAEQFAKAEGTAHVSGNGVGQPFGFMSNGDVAQVVSGHASTILADGLIALVHGIKSEYAKNGTFVFNRTTLSSIRKLKDTAGQYVFQAGMMLTGGVTSSVLGHPYIEATDMPSEGSDTFPVAFGDFRRGYMIVDRVQMAVLRDPFTQATSGNVRYIARRRVGGQVIQAEAIVKQKCST
jgi:HK97 family phage major capsid protein|tara:strand:- start:1520 stop:2737 length:1218 start_codon:yes stop_codon:yes gene_type:complete